MADLPDFDPYLVLGVNKTADAGVIKKAYRTLALKKHPDKCGGDEELKKLRTDEFQRLNEAYAIIGDEEQRARHDALVKLDALRKEKASLGRGAPRPFTRASTFSTGYPGTTATAYTSRGATNVEDRAPKYYDDEEYHSRRPATTDDYYNRRTAEKPPRAERARTAKDDRDVEERRRMERRREAEERRREADIRTSRSNKHDYEEERLRSRSWEEEKRRRDDEERSRRVQEDPLRQKYSDLEEQAQNYTGAKVVDPRPGMQRRSSTREVPRPYMSTRRSRASPKERSTEDTQRELERERQRLVELQEREREKERTKAERARAAAERERIDREHQARDRELRAEADRAAREKDKLERYERDRAREKENKRREKELLDQDRLERQARQEREKSSKREYPTVRQQKEYVEPYEKRPPILQHHNSSPPFGTGLPEKAMPRSRDDGVPAFSPHANLSRSSTTPLAPNSSARRTAAAPSKMRESATVQDSGYSSSSASEQRPRTASKQKVTTYSYARDGQDDISAEPPSRHRQSRESRDPAPSPLASKIAGMAASSGRPSTSYGTDRLRPEIHHTQSSRDSVPRRERGERERGRERTRDGPYYGERSVPVTSSYGEPTYSKLSEPSYSRPTTSRRETEGYQQPYSYARTGMVQS